MTSTYGVIKVRKRALVMGFENPHQRLSSFRLPFKVLALEFSWEQETLSAIEFRIKMKLGVNATLVLHIAVHFQKAKLKLSSECE